ncbi:MAG: hypothetical protein Q7W02_15885 [Candidatus Rokubacteria bacterium]|nr:hypothetical protein [Candidatus Rokubacteria bacterium]
MARAAKTRTYTLRRASSVVFALISVLPLLLFAYTLYALDVLHHNVAQIGLGSALVLSMIGFYIYSVMMSRLSDILRDLEADESAQPPSGATHGATQGPVVTMAVEPGPSGPMAESHTAGASRQVPAPPSGRPSPFAVRGRSGAGGRGGLVVPGMGRITELKPAAASALSDLDSMWRAEAEPLLGKRVLVAVRNAPDPMKGILAQVTQDGLILDQNGTRVGISYARVSAIEADTTPDPA